MQLDDFDVRFRLLGRADAGLLRPDLMAEAPSVISAITNPDLDPQNLQLWFDAAGRPVAVTMLSHKNILARCRFSEATPNAYP